MGSDSFESDPNAFQRWVVVKLPCGLAGCSSESAWELSEAVLGTFWPGLSSGGGCEDAGIYRYLTVRSDCRYGESVATCVLVEYLDSVSGLQRTDPAFYRAEDGLDWLHVTIAACDGAGNYVAHEGRVPQRVNMVELICSSTGGHPAYEAARVLAAGIADLLGWEVTDSESDEVLYDPGPVAAAPTRHVVECPACAMSEGPQSSFP
ncbi:hypothetical protein ACIP4W_11495 [Streptomyces sp. NPDC088846]|uniref:hypothetical protein n=1 Tax=Streptomyces sp. NPDC088846 TaxID=3365908 RepID=UPI003809A46B